MKSGSLPERLLRSLVAWTFTAAYWSLLLAAYLVTLKRLPPEEVAAAIRLWGRATAALLGVAIVFDNDCPFLERGARVIVVNHQSGLDLLWGAAICPPAPLAIGKREIVYVPIFNAIWWALDFIRIDRGNHERAMAALRGVSQKVTRERRTLVLSPEGTRSRTGEIGRFKKGAFVIARQAQVPVYPVVVHGAFELLPRGRLLPAKGTIRVRFLPAVDPTGFPGGSPDSLLEAVREAMVKSFQEMKSR